MWIRKVSKSNLFILPRQVTLGGVGLVKSNLIVTYDPAHSGTAKEEAEALLKAADSKGKFLDSEVDGVFMMKVSKPKELCKKLNKKKSLLKKMKSVFHWIPVDKWVKSTVKGMQKAVKSAGKDIKKEEKWKMDMDKRLWDKKHSTDLVIKLTEGVDKPNVDLEKPDKIIQVEIVKDQAGVSLLEPDEKVNIPALE